MAAVSELRIKVENDAQVRPDGEYVLYWMIAARRTTWNFALQRAVEWATKLGRPLVIFEALRAGYPWASDRLHRFVIEGMRDNAARLAGGPALYYPYVEPQPDADKGLLAALADRACVVVTDDFPCFFLPRMVKAVARRLDERLESVDSNGLLPLAAADRVFTLAHSFRRYLQKNLLPHLADMPAANPLARKVLPPAKLPTAIARRWPAANLDALLEDGSLAKLSIDHEVGPASFSGGQVAAHRTWRRFLTSRLKRYPEDRNEPDEQGTSGLSPYLHFGHISSHQVFHELMSDEEWTPNQAAAKASGSREGWWNVSPGAEAFLDQIVTWRELGYNMTSKQDDYDRYESLPDWAQTTLAKHARDERPRLYSLAELEAAATYDPLWNAAQRQMVREGWMHNYLRMLWGKKILEWSATPEEALETMIHLNNKYFVDGRNPNSYSGVFWIFGRYDRAWGPERKIFGKIRYMSSENTARKFSVKGYLQRYGA